jgi:hypothetical protein
MAAFDFARPRDETIPQLVDTPPHETKAASFNTIFTCEVNLVLAGRWRGTVTPTGGVEMKVRPCYLSQDLHMPGPQVYRRRRHSLRAEFASSKFEHYIVLHVPW